LNKKIGLPFGQKAWDMKFLKINGISIYKKLKMKSSSDDFDINNKP
jgi:hypothetical protein